MSPTTPDGWTTSSRCDFGQCLAVRRTGPTVQLRDTAQPAGPTLTVTTADFAAFVAGAKAGDFDTIAGTAGGAVSPVLAAYHARLALVVPDHQQPRLRALTAAAAGTAGDGHDTARAWICLDWLVRVHAPTWLRAARLAADAYALSGLAIIDSPARAIAAAAPLRLARHAAAHAAEPADPGQVLDAGPGHPAWDVASDTWPSTDLAFTIADDDTLDVASTDLVGWLTGAAWDTAGDAHRAARAEGRATAITRDRLTESAIGLYTSMIRPARTGAPCPA